jgi:hypothetical protein
MSGKYEWVDTSEPGVIKYRTPDYFMRGFDSLPPAEWEARADELYREWMEAAENRARIKIERLMFER